MSDLPRGDESAGGAWDAGEQCSYSLSVNGRSYGVGGGWVGESLLYVLRNRLGQVGSKNACEQGECGSCSVLVDGLLVCSCLVLAASAAGQEVVTVEGLGAQDAGDAGALSSIQAAFVDTGAVQCGFCTPGLVVAVHDLLESNPDPTDLEVREAISGNLCRCTGYGRILAAVEEAKLRRRSVAAGDIP